MRRLSRQTSHEALMPIDWAFVNLVVLIFCGVV